jgi:hypothetical protein
MFSIWQKRSFYYFINIGPKKGLILLSHFLSNLPTEVFQGDSTHQLLHIHLLFETPKVITFVLE